MLSRGLRGDLAAASRGDKDLQYLLYARDAEFHFDYSDWLTVDFQPVYRGIDD